MYCPSCGFESTLKTNYCKRCGEGLTSVGDTVAPKRTQPNMASMVWAVVTFSMSAMILLASLLLYIQSKGGWSWPKRYLPLLIGLGFTLTIATMLIGQLARIVTTFRRAEQKVIVEKHFIREPSAVQVGVPTDQIARAVDPSSVVEHTTRQFANLYESLKSEGKKGA